MTDEEKARLVDGAKERHERRWERMRNDPEIMAAIRRRVFRGHGMTLAYLAEAERREDEAKRSDGIPYQAPPEDCA